MVDTWESKLYGRTMSETAATPSAKALPDRLRTALHIRGMSRAELARRIGLTTSTVAGIAKGHHRPSLDCFASLCRELDVSADYLLGATPDVQLPQLPAAARAS